MQNNQSPGRNGYPVTPNGLSADAILRKAMQTKPPGHDPAPPKEAKAKRKTATPKKATGGT